MTRYALDEQTMHIRDADGALAIDADIGGLAPDDRLAIARCLRDLANGVEADLPPSVAYHWAFFGRPVVDPGRIYAKAPVTRPELGKARVWALVALAPDAELAKRMCREVNERLGWDVDGDIYRNIVENKTLVVALRDGAWQVTVSGETIGGFDDLDEAKETAVAKVLPARSTTGFGRSPR